RDGHVTGVQTCALPIFIPALERCEGINVLEKKILAFHGVVQRQQFQSFAGAADTVEPPGQRSESFIVRLAESFDCVRDILIRERSEERRVGKEWRCWGA